MMVLSTNLVLFNVYDLLDGLISWVSVIWYVEDLSMWWPIKFNALDMKTIKNLVSNKVPTWYVKHHYNIKGLE